MLHIEAAVAREKIAYVVPIGRHRLSQLSPAGAAYSLHMRVVAYRSARGSSFGKTPGHIGLLELGEILHMG